MIQRIVRTPSISHYGCVDDGVYEPGKYIYQIIAYYVNDCQSEPITIAVEVTSADEVQASEAVVYPNPTSDKISVKAEAMRQISVYNAMGQLVMIQTVDGGEAVLDMSQFENGMYLVNISTDKGNFVKRISVLR